MRVVIHLAGSVHALDDTDVGKASAKRVGSIFDTRSVWNTRPSVERRARTARFKARSVSAHLYEAPLASRRTRDTSTRPHACPGLLR